jgi:hypothetical protein
MGQPAGGAPCSYSKSKPPFTARAAAICCAQNAGQGQPSGRDGLRKLRDTREDIRHESRAGVKRVLDFCFDQGEVARVCPEVGKPMG